MAPSGLISMNRDNNQKASSNANIAESIRSHAIDHGLRTPNEAYFHQNRKILGLGRQFGQTNFGAFGVFSANLSAPIILVLFIQIPNIYLGFEVGLQRIRDLSYLRNPWRW